MGWPGGEVQEPGGGLCEVVQVKPSAADHLLDKRDSDGLSIKGVDMGVVRTYKYLGLHMDKKLDWIKKKDQGWLYFLRRLESFNIFKKRLLMFYHSAFASV